MPEKYTKYQERLATLRDQIKNTDLSGFILPCTDEFQGEFLAPYAQRLAWLTGFTGSAGVCVVLEDKAVVMSDGRYTIQLAQQVDAALYSCVDSTKTSVGDWLLSNANAGDGIGYDVWLHTPRQVEAMANIIEDWDISLIPMDGNLIDMIWSDQPQIPNAEVRLFPDDIAGQSSAQKRAKIAAKIGERGAQSCLLSVGDSIAWLLNIRGGDIAYSPLVLSYALLHDDGNVDWFVGRDKVPQDVSDTLGADIRIFELSDMEERIGEMSGAVMMDRSSAPIWFEAAFMSAGLEVLDEKDPCVHPKSIKSEAEKAALINAHIQDGAAMVKFLKWMDSQNSKSGMSERSVEAKLEAYRRESSAYIEPSFPTIAGFAENGAIVHYRATDQTNRAIDCDGLLLVDSGGQYHYGTTDITRTITIGAPTQEMRESYTRVLKGHIAVASARFKKGTTGKEIDALARAPLRDVGLDYAHGTGHGVGCYLCVHEGAANLSPRGEQALEAGMLLSNEPGYYKEGAYGIRIENLVLVTQDPDDVDMLCFKDVTLAPYDHALIDFSMLDAQDVSWLNAYNDDLITALSNMIEREDMAWLRSLVTGV